MKTPADSAIDAASDHIEIDESEVNLELTRLMFRNAGMAQAVTAINGGVLVFVLGGLTPPGWAVGWWLLALVVAFSRYWLARSFRRRDPPAAEAMLWQGRAYLGAQIAGLVWAGGGIALMTQGSESTRLFSALVMAGMVAGAVPILSSVPKAFRAYSATVMLSIVGVALFDWQGPRDGMLALVAVLFLLALNRSASFFFDSLDNSIRLALRMRAMVEQLERAKRDAEAASTAKSQFLAAMSHEIRTPLNGVLGMAQLLMIPGLAEDERLDYARTILGSGQTLLTLLNDILDLSKVEAGKLELSATAFDAEAMLTETLHLFSEPALQKGLTLRSEWRGPAAAYVGDATRLRQMLSNLINNAIKFTDNGEIRAEAFEHSCGEGGAKLEFAVIDSGIGIDASDRQRLFQAFSQVDGTLTRRFGGSGLGLSIVRSLAELMGGEVGVDSQPGTGSRFWFRVRVGLPAAAGSGPAAAGQTLELEAAPGALDILLVEDNVVNRKVMETMLEKLGHHVTWVENGALAVDAVSQGMRPDLVLMDCQMPLMDGFEATRRIRQWEQGGQRPPLSIIALTAGAFDEDRRLAQDAGMDSFLTKPVSYKDLAALLKRLVSN